MSRGVILGTDDETTSLLGASVDRLDDVDELLLVLQDPVQFVVVAGTEIAHDVFVAEEEHDSARIVQLC